MQNVYSGYQPNVGNQFALNSGCWNPGVQQACNLFLGPPMFGPMMGMSMLNDFSMMLMNQLLMNFMQGGMPHASHCPCHQGTGLYQPYQNMPYGPRPQVPHHHPHQHNHNHQPRVPFPRPQLQHPDHHHHEHGGPQKKSSQHPARPSARPQEQAAPTKPKAPAPQTRSKTYDPTKDAGALEKAMNGGMLGLGTDEETIMKTLRGKSKEEIELLKKNYKDHYGKDLDQQLKKELNSKELARAQDLMKGKTEKADAQRLKEATSGLGDDEEAIYETLKGKTPEQREVLKKEYKQLTGRDLNSTLKSRLSKSEYQRASSLLEGNNAKADAAKLKDALSGLGDDEEAVYQTLRGKSDEERAAIKKEYKQLTGQELSDRMTARLSKSEQNQALGLLEGNSAKADAAKLHDAMDGLGTNEKAIFSTLEGKSAEERAAITKAYKQQYGVDLEKQFAKEMGGNDLKRAGSLLKQGEVSDSLKLRHAMEGIGTDESAVKEVLQGKSKEEIAQIRASYKRETGRDLEKDLKSELGGRDQFDAMQALKGRPTSIDEAMQRMDERHAFERDGLGNKISNSVMDTVNDKGELLDKNHARATEQYDAYKKAVAEGRTSDAAAAKDRLQQLLGYTDLDVTSYQESKDAVADTAGTIAATAAATAVIVGTAGTGTPLVATALAAAGAGAGARAVTTSAVAGSGYDMQNLAADAAVGAVDGATTVLGAGAGRAAASSLQAARGAAKTGRVASLAVEGAVDGVVGGAAGGAASEALRDETWSNGLGEGLKRVGVAGGLVASVGAVAGGGTGAIGGAAPAVVRGGKKAIETAGELGQKGRAVARELGHQGRQALGELGDAGRRALNSYKEFDAKAQEAIRNAFKNGDPSNLTGKARDFYERVKGSETLKGFREQLNGGGLEKLKETGRKAWGQLEELDTRAKDAIRKAIQTGDDSNLTGKARELWDKAKQSGGDAVDDLKAKLDDAKIKAEQDAKVKAQQDAKLKADQDAKIKAQQDAKLKAEQEAKLKAQEEARLKAKDPDFKIRQEVDGFANRDVHRMMSSSPKFKELSATEQLDLLKMADRHQPDAGFFRRLFRGDRPSTAQQNLRKLLDEGKMLQKGMEGESLLKNLQDLEQTKMPKVLNPRRIFDETLDTIANPGKITQETKATCSATAIQYIHAKTDPSDYVRVMAGLADESGEATLRTGKVLHRNATGLNPDNSGRRHTDRLYQSSAMDHSNEGRLRYDNKADAHFDHEGKEIHGGLTPDQSDVLARDILGGARLVESYRGEVTPEARELFIQRLKKQIAETDEDFHVGMKWGEEGDMHALHAVSAYDVDDKYVYVRNPWGKSDSGQGPVAREMLDGEGRSRIKHDEFFSRLKGYKYKPLLEGDKLRHNVAGVHEAMSIESVPKGQKWMSEEFLGPRTQQLFPGLDVSKVPKGERINFYMDVHQGLYNAANHPAGDLADLTRRIKSYGIDYDPRAAILNFENVKLN